MLIKVHKVNQLSTDYDVYGNKIVRAIVPKNIAPGDDVVLYIENGDRFWRPFSESLKSTIEKFNTSSM